MGILAGTCCFQREIQRPLAFGAISAYLRIAGFTEPDDISTHTDAGAVISYAQHTEQGSAAPDGPFARCNRAVLAWHGRLDNRPDLIRKLGPHLSTASDAGVAMAAYGKWGEAFLGTLVGEWALSLWDFQSKCLLLARDFAGGKTLFYNFDSEHVRWCTHIRGILEFARTGVEINDRYVAGFLALSPEPSDTPYRDIRAVPPGFVVSLCGGEAKERRFWSLDPMATLHYGSDDEYEEQFRHLLRTAVKRRVVGRKPIAIQLSGGLDSSAVVCLAYELLRNAEIEASGVETISYVYDKAESCDERAFIEHVERKVGRKGHHLIEDEAPCLSLFEGDFVAAPTFHHAFCRRQRSVEQRMREIGSNVLLTGQGGDQVLYGSEDPSPGFADLVVSLKFTELRRRFREWDARSRLHRGHIARNVIAAIAPPSLRRNLMPVAQTLEWLNRDFVRKHEVARRFGGCRDEFACNLPSKREQSCNFLSGLRSVTAAQFQEWWPFDVSHPYFDRDLIEFLQAIPFEQQSRAGQSKSLFRRSLRTTLPATVLERRDKRGPDEALYRALARQWQELRSAFSRPLSDRLGYVDGPLFFARLQRAAHGCTIPPMASLLLTICLEYWLISRASWRRSCSLTI